MARRDDAKTASKVRRTKHAFKQTVAIGPSQARRAGGKVTRSCDCPTGNCPHRRERACDCLTGRCPHRRAHATKRTIEGAAIRTYGDSGKTMAYVEWSDGSRLDGDLIEMEPLLSRAKREGVRIRHEVW
jgi:hypothetical protein